MFPGEIITIQWKEDERCVPCDAATLVSEWSARARVCTHERQHSTRCASVLCKHATRSNAEGKANLRFGTGVKDARPGSGDKQSDDCMYDSTD